MSGERFRGRRFTSTRDFSKKESSSHGDKEKWKEKKNWCVSNAKNWDTLNMIVPSTKVKPRGE